MTGPHVRWRKSSHSTANSDCVEVACRTAVGVAVRDSKQPESGQLTLSAASWASFRDELNESWTAS